MKDDDSAVEESQQADFVLSPCWQELPADVGNIIAQQIMSHHPIVSYLLERLCCYTEFKGHEGEIVSVGFNGSGSQFMTASRDGAVKIWGVSDHQLHHHLAGEKPIKSAVFNGEGTSVYTHSTEGTVQLWQVADGVVTSFGSRQDPLEQILCIQNHPVLFARARSGVVKAWSTQTAKILYEIEKPGLHSSFIAGTPSGQLARGYDNGTIAICDALSGQEVAVLKGHVGLIHHLSFSNDGLYLVSSSADTDCRIWECATWNCKMVFTKHQYPVVHASFRPGSTMVVSIAIDYDRVAALELPESSCYVWEYNDSQMLYQNGSMHYAEFSPSGRCAVFNNSRELKVLDDLLTLELGASVRALAFHPHQELLVTATISGKVTIWALGTFFNVRDCLRTKLTILEAYLLQKMYDNKKRTPIKTIIPPMSAVLEGLKQKLPEVAVELTKLAEIN